MPERKLRLSSALLPEALRLLMIKSDGSVMVHADTGGFKPQNWMTPPTRVTETEGSIVVEKGSGKALERLEILIAEVISEREKHRDVIDAFHRAFYASRQTHGMTFYEGVPIRPDARGHVR